MEPDAGESVPPGVGAALGDFILVMREDQVHATRMDIQHVDAQPAADELERHRGALDMPARTAAPEWRIPRRADRLVRRPRGLPEGEVARTLLGVLVGADALARPGSKLAPVEL